MHSDSEVSCCTSRLSTRLGLAAWPSLDLRLEHLQQVDDQYPGWRMVLQYDEKDWTVLCRAEQSLGCRAQSMPVLMESNETWRRARAMWHCTPTARLRRDNPLPDGSCSRRTFDCNSVGLLCLNGASFSGYCTMAPSQAMARTTRDEPESLQLLGRRNQSLCASTASCANDQCHCSGVPWRAMPRARDL